MLALVIVILALGIIIPTFIMPRLINQVLGQVVPGAKLGGLSDLVNSDQLLRSQFGMETSELIGIEPTRFDAFAVYPQVAAFAGDNLQLVKIRAYGVRLDGTMDLMASYTPAPRAEYEYIRNLAGPPPDAPPVGTGGQAGSAWQEKVKVDVFQPGQLRNSSTTNNGVGYRIQWQNRGMVRQNEKPTAAAKPEATNLAVPTCPLTLIWQQALSRGAPPDAIATVEYTRDGYDFSIQGTQVRFRLSPTCQPVNR
jgi:hypothetical protein